MRTPLRCVTYILLLILIFYLCGSSYAANPPTGSVSDYLESVLPDCSKKDSKRLAASIKRVSTRCNIPEKTLLAFVLIESSGKKRAVNRGCLGLTQINYSVWGKQLKAAGIIKKRSDLFIPDKSLEACVYVFRHYKGKHNNSRFPVKRAIISYSGGSHKYYHRFKKIVKHYTDYTYANRKKSVNKDFMS